MDGKALDAAAKAWAKGDKRLAEAYKAGFNTCRKMAEKVYDTKLPEKYDRRRKLGEKEVKEMLRLREEGWTYSALASKFGVSSFCPQYWCKHSEIKAYNRKWQKEKYDSLDEKAKRSLLDMHMAATKNTLKYKEKLALRGAI
jgi:hypothetical protein